VEVAQPPPRIGGDRELEQALGSRRADRSGRTPKSGSWRLPLDPGAL